MKIGFFTLGCKVNQYETEAMKEKFLERGHEVLLDETSQGADVYVINTCTVTNLADRKSRQFIRRAKKENPEAIIAVTGCYAQIDPDAVSKIEGVDVVAGTGEKKNLPEYIEAYLRERQGVSCHIKAYEELDSYESDGIITAMESRTRAYIKIEEGCNRFCSYCIIPYARGRVRSREEEEIIREATGLVERGFKEIVLTGINTALYGQDKTNEFGLAKLLLKIDEIPGDFRVRLSSLEPTVVSRKDVMSVLDSKRLCHHLHLSCQSGSDNVLSAMKRRYTRQEYLDIVKTLREIDPSFGITTDIIVGFPGETEEDFQDSINLVKEAELSKVHVFRYSPRKGTDAASMENQIPGEEKGRRSAILSKEAEAVSKAFLQSLIGKEERVLLEEKKGEYITGYSDNYTRVYLNAKDLTLFDEVKDNKYNEFVRVKLTSLYKDGMKGEIIDG